MRRKVGQKIVRPRREFGSPVLMSQPTMENGMKHKVTDVWQGWDAWHRGDPAAAEQWRDTGVQSGRDERQWIRSVMRYSNGAFLVTSSISANVRGICDVYNPTFNSWAPYEYASDEFIRRAFDFDTDDEFYEYDFAADERAFLSGRS